MTEQLPTTTARPLVDYYPRLANLSGRSDADSGWEPLPLPSVLPDALRPLLASAEMRWIPAPQEAPINAVLDLRSDPRTQTTKTFPSLLMVARAVNHIWSTGEKITILTPSSANKATALRSAVLHAIELGLVDASSLSIVSVVPRAASQKLRRSALSSDPLLRTLNPLLVLPGDEPEAVKPMVSAAAAVLVDRGGDTTSRLWLTLKLDNYTVADAARALFEAAVSPATDQRLHAHAVSSAYGLLGYARGLDVLRSEGVLGTGKRPGYLLVQHLYTSDMVQHLLQQTPPEYRWDEARGFYRQDDNVNWPAETDDPAENMETTFYTHAPATRDAMSELIHQSSGTGVVVSKRDCLAEMDAARGTLGRLGIALPEDVSQLREWATVMCWTGVAKARRQKLIHQDAEVILHASGSYSDQDYEVVPEDEYDEVFAPADVVAAVERVNHERSSGR